MRLEVEYSEQVMARALSLIEVIDARVQRLALEPQAIVELRDDVSTFRMYCLSLHMANEVIELLEVLETLLREVGSGQVILDDQVGGLLLHAVATNKLALQTVHSPSGASVERVSRVLRELKKVASNVLRRKVRAQKPEPRASESPYLREFFSEQSYLKFEKIISELIAGQIQFDSEFINDFFRVIHTVKGNASIVGLTAVSEAAHLLEDHLARARDTGLAEKNIAEIVKQSLELKSVLDEARLKIFSSEARTDQSNQAANPTAIQNQPRHCLHVAIAGRDLLLPCDSVVEILRNPTVMPIPGDHQDFLGLIRAHGKLFPLLPASALADVSGESKIVFKQWAVILKSKARDENTESLFAVAVDEIFKVVALLKDQDATKILNPSKIKLWA